MIKPFRANKSGAHLASMSGGVETPGKKENTFLTSKSVGGSLRIPVPVSAEGHKCLQELE